MRLRLLVSEAWRSLAANMSTTFAAMMTVLIGMFLLGLLIAFGTWAISWSNHVKRELVVQIDFKVSGDKGGEATHVQEDAVARRLQVNPLVKTFKFVSKEQALVQMERTEKQLIQVLPFNPFPDTIIVTPKYAEDLGKLYASLHPLSPGVQKIVHDTHDSNRILHFAKWVEVIFGIAAAVLLASASLLIANTIRLIEGLLCGVGGAFLAVLLLVIGKQLALPAILHNELSTAPDVHALAFPLIALILMGLGLGLGALGSGITLRRFLRV